MSNGWMTEDQIREKFAGIVAESLHIEPEQVTPEAYLDELGAESLDLIEISMEVESQFKIWLPEKSILQTAMEIYGPGVLERDGVLTEEGKALLQNRMPAEDAGNFTGEVTLKDVQHYFMQVKTWIRMIDGLLAYTPTTCSCGGTLASSLGFRLKCTACAQEVTLRSGDEINREWVESFRGQGQEATAGAPNPSGASPAAA